MPPAFLFLQSFGDRLTIIALDVRLDSYPDPIGNLYRDDNGALAFAYTAAYLGDPTAYPLSLSLPLTAAPFEDNLSRPFFDNLLQERDGALRQVMDREGLARDDVAGLLFHLGKDCAGAISVLPFDSPPVKVPGDYDKDYRKIEDDRLKAIVKALHERQRLPDGTADPSPLAGVQSKIAITVLPDGTYAEPLPGSGAPTTHILKVPDQAHLQDPRLEAKALSLSRDLDFETTDASVVKFGDIDALVITRFDRRINSDGKIVRIHQEDFAQALGLPPSLKYERNGHEERRFDVNAISQILNATIDPAKERQQFIAATLFDLMIGNVDAHAKNFALLYEPGGRIQVAPRYDLIPTRLDPALTEVLPYSIGMATTLADITIADFALFLSALGISSPRAQARIRDHLTLQLADGLAAALKPLELAGMKRFADLIANNIITLLTAFDLPLPNGISTRDAYIEQGGGWLLGS
ncbi:HipA domain-containing protein [Rhizobium rhizogenes]|uniref:HipA domain-containing protein n=1 Tax=Rhizobium rhizogenes TaxID=359 RepID=UPI001574961D|nr:HipA domain-containing protein [Rhizobium rhizogenes]NTF91690.1 type II toxin-antitoxin system HipA family toxin [Rhizobium rhizogenes]NTG25525.1 type II toxin-antitoxin system HipA family toxin [Rhizobium rhizogenes]NTH23456.1 type II toxin-antitoxin system HipA family toxin [Rhizobium rhizogenes]